MLIIIFGILTLVYCSKYKKQPLLPTLSALKTFTVIHTVLFCFGAISLISSVAMFATGALFETFEDMILAVFRSAEVDVRYLSEFLGSVNDFVSAIMWSSIIIDAAIIIFGVIALIIGVKTFADKELAAAAAANTAAETQRKQAMFAQNMNRYQQNTYNQQGYGYNQQYNQQYNPQYNQQNVAYQNNMAQNPQQNSFTTQPAANVNQAGWICGSCGSSNISVANFCSHCGAKH